MKSAIYLFFLVLGLFGLSSGVWAGEAQPISAREQKALTPEEVLEDLMRGNARYVSNTVSEPHYQSRREAATTGQYPQAYILSCVDSRVPVEPIFDQGLGDIFVGRVAGNIENEDQLGSMEFASAVAGVKVILVLGHEACGAVKGACDDVKLGNLTALVSKIRPAVEAVDGFEEDRSSKNPEFVATVVETNVKQTVEDIRQRSEVLSGLENEEKLKIIGGLYSLHTGQVTLLPTTMK
mgnify:CR=1 FL=1